MRLVQKKNLTDIHVLICYFNGSEPRINKVFFLSFLQENWYWNPVGIGFFKVPYSPRSPYRDKNVKLMKLKFILKRYKKILAYRQFFLKILEFYLEDKLKRIVGNVVRIRLYNILDYYNIYETNIFTTYMTVFVKLFPKEQKNLYRGIKTHIFYMVLGVLRKNSFLIAKTFSIGLEKYKRSGKVLNLFFKILREIFYLVPLKSRLGDVMRAEYLKIQISGKVNGQMRAVKKIYSFSYYKGKQVPIQTLKTPVDYSLTEAYTFAGVLGIKV
jgi:hypothetical protein|tara:strand:+ start:30998 stop:31807 length:810 start_codon:yes stop_codon:yes gene_type:complete